MGERVIRERKRERVRAEIEKKVLVFVLTF